MKTHWKKLENPDYLGAYSLPDGKDLSVKIEKVVREMITGTGGKKEECTVLYLKGQKPMILNRTNAKMIQQIYNTPYIEEWVGKIITLTIAKIKAFGEDNVECLRIKREVVLPDLVYGTDDYNAVLTALKAGNCDMLYVKKRYILSKELETKLTKEI
jgi:hypothetical protein